MKKPRITFLHRLEYAAVQLVAQTVCRLPLDIGPAIGAGAGRFFGRLTGLRSRALKNFSFAMPDLDEKVQSVALTEMFDGLTRMLLEYTYLQDLNDDPDRIEIEGLEHLHAAKESGKGALLVTGHFGNWETIRIAFARHDWPAALIYRAFNNPLFDEYSRNLMSVVDAPIYHKGRRGSLGMLRHVRRGGAALILTDQRFNGAPEIPFFGHPAKTSLGAAEIALNYDVILLPVRGERLGRSSTFKVIIEPPVNTENKSAEAVTGEINNRLETWIRAHPEQYFWMHNRWGKISSEKHRRP